MANLLPPVLAPIAGRVVALADLPDPVFAQAMVGPGAAIYPRERGGLLDVHSPISGVVSALHPHAFAVEGDHGAVLVHLGLDTVTLKGEPYTVLVTPGQRVEAGETVVRWAVSEIGALSPLVPVIALGAESVEILAAVGSQVDAGDPLFEVPAVQQ